MQKTLNNAFEAVIQKSPSKGGWTYIVWPGAAACFGTRGLVKVRASVDDISFESAFMPLGDGTHKLPLKAALLKRIAKSAGDSVTITLQERLN